MMRESELQELSRYTRLIRDAATELLTNWRCNSRIKLPTDFIQMLNWRIGDAAAESGRTLTDLYRGQIGKSAMQQRNNRVGDFMHTDFMQETIILTSS